MPVLVTWAYSNYGFALALPTERTEAILPAWSRLHLLRLRAARGLVGQPQDGGSSSSTAATVAAQRLRGPGQPLHLRAAVLHAGPRQREAPRRDTRVRLQQQWATPVPRVADLDALNAHLRRCCLGERATGQWRPQSRSASASRATGPRPAAAGAPFDACVLQSAQVDKYQTVQFDHNPYSVPRAAPSEGHGQGLRRPRRGGADGQVVARHAAATARTSRSSTRCITWRPGTQAGGAGPRPGLRDWQLPASFADLRRNLEHRHGPRVGGRQYIRVLQLLAEHPLARVQQARGRAAAAARQMPTRSPDGWNGWPEAGPAAWDGAW